MEKYKEIMIQQSLSQCDKTLLFKKCNQIEYLNEIYGMVNGKVTILIVR